MAILRSRGTQGEAVRLNNPAVERSILAWEKRVEDAEAAAYQRAREELRAEYDQRIADAEERAQQAEASVEQRIAELDESHRQQWQQTLASLSAVSAEADHLRQQALAAAEGEIVRLALAIAGRIVHREIASEQQPWLQDVLTHALADLPAREGVVLRLHPDAVAVVEDHLRAALQDLADPPSAPRVVGDEVLKPGSCRIECAGTVIDVGLPGAWSRISEHLLAQAPSQDLSASFHAEVPTTADSDQRTVDADDGIVAGEDQQGPQ